MVKPIAPVSIYVFLLFLFLFVLGFLRVSAQTDENTITFKVENEKLNNTLVRLSGYDNVNLSFNASDPSFQRRLSYSGENKHVEVILSEILSKTGHDYERIGNHWVVFPIEETSADSTASSSFDVVKPADQFKETELSHQNPGKDTIVKVVEVPVLVIDTIRITDVITKTDTVMIRDTVFIEKPVPQTQSTQNVGRMKNIFRFEPDREDGWALSFSYAQLYSGYNYPENLEQGSELEQVKDSESPSFRNFSLGTDIQLNRQKFSFRAGLHLTGFSHNFTYAKISETGGYYDIDTLDVFYTVVQADTSYIYVTDSSWIPLDRNALTYDRYNRIGLLELHLGIGYTLYAAEDIGVYLKSAFDIGLPVWLNGSTILNEEGYPSTELTKELFTGWTYAYQLGVGTKYKFSNWADIYGEIYYKRYINQFEDNYPLERRLYGIGLKIGLLYYL